MKRNALALGLSRALTGALLLASTAHAADGADAGGIGAAVELDRIEVTGGIVYRDRAEEPATLVYDLAYFQQFEPLTVGDMLKRVPSIAFVSDVLEYDGARLRGLDPGYTQILINGKKVPGAGSDRSFFVDRIPAEMVERIEIVRSGSANRSGDAVAGAINIVLRNAYEFDGGYLRVGAMGFADGEIKPNLGAVISGDAGDGRYLLGFNHQGRYNPKQKRSDRFEEPGGDFVDAEDQSDIRDGDDTSVNASWRQEIGSGELSLSGMFVRTDRTETEHSLEYNDPLAADRDHLLSDNHQLETIRQDNYALSLGYAFDMAGGRTDIELSHAAFDDDTVSTEEEVGFDDDDSPPSFDEFEGERELTDQRDSELAAKIEHERALGGAEMAFGLDYQDKRRRSSLSVSKVDTDEEGAALPPFDDFDVFASRIEERRLDPYLMFSGDGGSLQWEAGLRYETTDTEIHHDGSTFSQDYGLLLPSAHLRWALGDADRVSLSLARSVRRPNFNHLDPTLLEGEFGDNDFIGNPLLQPETANGIDLGFEHRIGARGIVGVNVFYRDVSDLIELVNTGEPSDEAIGDYEDDVEEFLDENPGADENTPGYPEFDPDSFVYTAANVGNGQVYGIEFDVSMPLTAFGLENTGVFANASWLDSRVDDAIGERRFNDQARYVYNLGFIHSIEEAGVSFGASYRKQGAAESRVLAEEVRTEYGADLEAFVEKRFGENLVLRLTGSNLLDASKDEFFHKFDTLGDQLDRDYDEYELESESSGRVWQLMLRYAF